MQVNEAVWDRVIRVVAGLLLLYLGWGGVVAGTLGTVFKWLGFLPLLTGVIGYCPAYPLLGIKTKKA
jgi:Inner membrane protein YgaP-like, transmembrane domain